MSRAIALSIIAVGSMVAGCTKPNPTYCDDATGRVCEAGFHCVDHSCVADSDAMTGGPDARGAVVSTYQSADRVLGQLDFTDDTAATCSGVSLRPVAIAASDSRIYGGDYQERVLIWTPIPTEDHAASALVMGQPDFQTCGSTSAPTANQISSEHGLFVAGDKVFATELFQSRVRIWSSVGSNNEGADLVLGQPNMTTNDPVGAAADEFEGPVDVWSDGQRLVVADVGNHRVLIWNEFPTVNRQPADVVLGYDGFGENDERAPSASTFSDPLGVWSDGDRLFVSDVTYNRVLIWNTFPTENGQPADVVVGAGSFDVAPAEDLSAHGFAGPTDIVTVDDAMFVADPANHRILVWSPIPTSNGVGATFVLGQPDMTSADVGSEPSARSLHSPVRLAIGGDGLWVADQLDNRIVRYQLYPE